jgi:hypothetical protein
MPLGEFPTVRTWSCDSVFGKDLGDEEPGRALQELEFEQVLKRRSKIFSTMVLLGRGTSREFDNTQRIFW